jgi:arylformamidase
MAQASSPKEKHVFLHYTQAELDRNYDQRGWVSNANEVIARYISASKEVRSTLTYRTEAYGDHPDEQMDIFPAPRPSGAGFIFLHGGAWRNFTKDGFSFIAIAACRSAHTEGRAPRAPGVAGADRTVLAHSPNCTSL